MLTDKKLFLFDIDGTIAVGNTLYEGSRALLNYIDAFGGKSYYITNNSTRSGRDYVRKFEEQFQLKTTEDQFITSGFMTIRFLKDRYKNRKIFVMATASFLKDLRENGLTVTETPDPDIACVVAAYDSELNYRKLTAICQALSTTQVPFYATNPDLCCPTYFGFVPDCGAMCQMITASTGKTPIYLGKPNKEVVEYCLEISGFTREQTLVVGDRLYTDIACGLNAGVDTCVVFTGEASPEDLKGTAYTPTCQFDTIQNLYDALRKAKNTPSSP